MTFRKLFIFAAPALLLCAGCITLHQKPSILPPYIQKIAIRPFSNHTQQYGLEDKLTLAVQSEFNRDGRYQITTENQADALVAGDITRYILEPLSYDANHVPTEYKLTILLDATLNDKVKDQILWHEPGMVGELRFFATSSGLAGEMTEVDAQQVIWDQMARDIRTRTFEGFGTVTESSGSLRSPSPENLNTPPPMPDQQPPAPSPTRLPY